MLSVSVLYRVLRRWLLGASAIRPESTAGDEFNRTPFCISMESADRRWGFGELARLEVEG